MIRLPFDPGTIHFVGIGGIGMSGIAEILHNLDYRVQGSDQVRNANVQRLEAMGIPVTIGHKAENIEDARVVVVSTAVKADNPEVAAARARFVPVVRRAEMLGELMRLKWAVAVGGTHGKTTTTSIIAAIFDHAGLDPTVINGGIINAYGTNARLGQGDWMVVEADESDGSFVKLPATIAVVTNIDPEHLDFYGSVEALHDAFKAFVGNIPFYGVAVLCIDHPVVQSLIGRIRDRRVITYGLSPQAEVRATNLVAEADGVQFDVAFAGHGQGADHVIEGLEFPMLGRHNVLNALAAIAIAREMGISDQVVRTGLAQFGGVTRRFTKTGETRGITVIDDYGHHPVEIAAVLEAARQATSGKVIAVVQPHRFTRLASLFEEFCACFNDADHVIVTDVYSAGETPIEGASRDSLVEGLRARGLRNVTALTHLDLLAPLISDLASAGDLVIYLGAGNITTWANDLPRELEQIFTNKASRGIDPGQ